MKRLLPVFASFLLVFSSVHLAVAQPPEGPGGPGGYSGPGGPEGRMPSPLLLRIFDADNNGEISAAEMDAATAALKKLDRNQDGKLASEELFGSRGPGMGGGPGGGGGPGIEFGPGRPGEASTSSVDNPLKPKNDAEKKIVDAIKAMQQGQRFANVSSTDGRLLRLLTEAIGAKRVVEIGTSTGESATWFALALKTTGGKLVTYEIDPGRAKVAQENFKRAGVDNVVTIVVGDAHEKVKDETEPIDILFLDADKQGYVNYLEKLIPKIRPGGLVIAHNMKAPAADARYVKAITQDPNLETTFLLMEGSGVGVTLKKR